MSIITVNGRVTKTVGTSGAFQIVETYNGDWTRYWTVWNKDANNIPAVDSFIKVTGEYNSKIRSYEANNGDQKTAVDRSINEPVFEIDNTAGLTDKQLNDLGAVLVEDIEDETPF